jgi:hypothetical protein
MACGQLMTVGDSYCCWRDVAGAFVARRRQHRIRMTKVGYYLASLFSHVIGAAELKDFVFGSAERLPADGYAVKHV